CGLRAHGTISCWGDLEDYHPDAPDGHFTAVTAGDEHTCALRADGTIACWGPFTWPPDGVHYADR
ncbi:MAG: RCC1 domain-containing protein, partial [bacterium]|nr:RCC1 domain-containing protein [bacterium]